MDENLFYLILFVFYYNYTHRKLFIVPTLNITFILIHFYEKHNNPLKLEIIKVEN